MKFMAVSKGLHKAKVYRPKNDFLMNKSIKKIRHTKYQNVEFAFMAA